MKLKNKSDWAKYQAKQEWHTWFAWYPVRINHDLVVWLEKVERRYVVIHGCLKAEYKINE